MTQYEMMKAAQSVLEMLAKNDVDMNDVKHIVLMISFHDSGHRNCIHHRRVLRNNLLRRGFHIHRHNILHRREN